MTDPDTIQDSASHVVLHAWIASYLRPGGRFAGPRIAVFAEDFNVGASRLRDSALLLQAALEKMRIANERLAARMAEHRAFFAKYQAPE